MPKITPPLDTDDPNVIAYRVGELEKAVKEGFKNFEIKLDLLRDGFVSHQQMEDELKKAEVVHKEMFSRIKKLEEWLTWIQRLTLGAVVLAILAVVIKGAA